MKNFFNSLWEVFKLPILIVAILAYSLGILVVSLYFSFLIFSPDANATYEYSMLTIIVGMLIFAFIIGLTVSLISKFTRGKL